MIYWMSLMFKKVGKNILSKCISSDQITNKLSLPNDPTFTACLWDIAHVQSSNQIISVNDNKIMVHMWTNFVLILKILITLHDTKEVLKNSESDTCIYTQPLQSMLVIEKKIKQISILHWIKYFVDQKLTKAYKSLPDCIFSHFLNTQVHIIRSPCIYFFLFQSTKKPQLTT